MTEQKPNDGQVKTSNIFKKDANLDLKKIDGSGAKFYNEVKDAVKMQHKEMMQFNEVDETQLRLVVQL